MTKSATVPGTAVPFSLFPQPPLPASALPPLSLPPSCTSSAHSCQLLRLPLLAKSNRVGIQTDHSHNNQVKVWGGLAGPTCTSNPGSGSRANSKPREAPGPGAPWKGLGCRRGGRPVLFCSVRKWKEGWGARCCKSLAAVLERSPWATKSNDRLMGNGPIDIHSSSLTHSINTSWIGLATVGT